MCYLSPEQTTPPLICHCTFTFPVSRGVWKAHCLDDSVSSSGPYTPIVAHDISSRCGMREVVLIFLLFLTFLSQLRNCRQYPRCSREAFPVPYATSVPPHIGVPDSLPSLLGQAGGMLSFLHAEQARAGGHRAQGFRGRPIHLMHNSWPLWTFQLRPLSLMGNPNGDLFIKTISWLFVVPASHEGATSRPGIITSSFDLSVLALHFDYINMCQIIYCTLSINPHLSLV